MSYRSMLHKCKSLYLICVDGEITLVVLSCFFGISGQISDIYIISKYVAQF
jgi:hypothetical protein